MADVLVVVGPVAGEPASCTNLICRVPIRKEAVVEGDAARELETILDNVSYELTNARTAGLDDGSELRASLRRARELITDADALAAGVEADRSRGSG